MTAGRVYRVALDTPLRRLFDYLGPETAIDGSCPSGPAITLAAGMRVRVPFGRQRLVGIIIEIGTSSDLPVERLKAILAVLDTAPILSERTLGLLRWASDYYHH